MTLTAMQGVVARLLTNPAFQRTFYQATAADSASYGLEPHEFQALRRIDAAHLEVVSEGYTGKRLERVESCFPRTLAVLFSLVPEARRHYLSHTPFPRNDAEERKTFQEYVRSKPGHLPEEHHRLLQDIALVERTLYELPSVVPHRTETRPAPTRDRPRLSRLVASLRLQGPLWEIWPLHPQLPNAYPFQPTHVVVGLGGPSAFINPLSTKDQETLAACDGTQTLAQISQRFGADGARIVKRWMREGLLEIEDPERRPS